MGAATMEEAAIITQLLNQLASYVGEWHLQLPHTFSPLLNSVLILFQSASCLLQKPTLLQSSTPAEKEGRSNAGSPTPVLVSQVQLRLLYLVSGCLSVLKKFTPNLSHVLTHPSFDLNAWPNLVSMSFTASDSEFAPSFGTLMACVTCSSSILAKLDPVDDKAVKSGSGDKTESRSQKKLHALLNYILETALHVTMTQCARYLRDPQLTPREKQLLKRELATELNTFLSSMTKVVRKSTSSASPKSKDRKSSSSSMAFSTSTLAASIKDHNYFRLVNVFIKHLLNK